MSHPIYINNENMLLFNVDYIYRMYWTSLQLSIQLYHSDGWFMCDIAINKTDNLVPLLKNKTQITTI